MQELKANKDIRIEASWKLALAEEFSKEYFQNLSDFIRTEYKSKTIHPKPKDIFKAFDLCPFDQINVVVLGQDPYHGPMQANGLSFAVNREQIIPPSLQNIFKEIESDLNIKTYSKDGDLSDGPSRVVLLLNSVLTVESKRPGSHQKKGWEEFTDAVIGELSKKREGLVFLLWGNYAKQKGFKIDRTKHLVLEAAHPSPFSAHNGFFGSKHLSKTNAYLKKVGKKEIDWR